MAFPFSLRATLCALVATLTSAALYTCIQGAVMLYELHQFALWMERVVE